MEIVAVAAACDGLSMYTKETKAAPRPDSDNRHASPTFTANGVNA